MFPEQKENIGTDWFEDNGEVETVVTPITGSGRDHPTIRNVLFVVGNYVEK
jgi:hypothetical protein